MTIFEKIVKHCGEKNYVKIKRSAGCKSVEYTHGYLLGYSFEFILLIENDDFRFNGYSVFPISSILKIRHNRYDNTSTLSWSKKI